MNEIDQGDIIRVSGGRVPFLVVSSAIYNQSGLTVVCPVVPQAQDDAMHVHIETGKTSGVVLCEQLAVVSASARGCSVRDHLSGESFLEIIYRVQSIFDYFPHAE